MKDKTITGYILEKMVDTDDPKFGAVFEKTVKTDSIGFDIFMKTVHPLSQGITSTDEPGVLLILYHDKDNKHIGTFNHNNGEGYFGGSRVGSQNPWLKPSDPPVKDPFVYIESERDIFERPTILGDLSTVDSGL